MQQTTRNSGSLTVTMHSGDELHIHTPAGVVTVYLGALTSKRASLNVKAPREWPIVRATAER